MSRTPVLSSRMRRTADDRTRAVPQATADGTGPEPAVAGLNGATALGERHRFARRH